MALQQPRILDNGIYVVDAYFKIETVKVGYNKTNPTANLLVYIYANKASCQAGKPYIDMLNINIPKENLNGGVFDKDIADQDNMIRKGYLYLKTLPDFSTATDV